MNNKLIHKRLHQDRSHKNNHNNQPSSIRSLKSIINESRIPLSQYINQRTSVQKLKSQTNEHQYQQNHYFKKLRGMFNNNHLQIPAQNEEEQRFQKRVQKKIKLNQIDEYQHYQYRETCTVNYDRSRSKLEEKQSVSLNKVNKLNIKTSTGNTNTKANCRMTETSSKYRIKKQVNNNNNNANGTPLRKDRVMTTYSHNNNNNNSKRPHYPNANIFKQKQQMKEQNSNYEQKKQTFQNSVQKIESYRRITFQKKEKLEIINYQKFQSLISFSSEQKGISKVTISKVLGVGAHTYVKFGQDKVNQQKYAIKIYQKYKLIQPNQIKRVLKEINLLEKINHPNIIRLINAYQDKRQIHMLFQSVQNSVTLHQYFRIKNFCLNEKDLAFILKQLINGLQHLHSIGISHRDIKTQNILIGISDGNIKVKIIDFGFATSANSTDIHCGTPNYMAPELFLKGKTYNPSKVDMWALGVMIYYLLEGKYPFRGYNQKDLIRNIQKQNIQFIKCRNNSKMLIKSLLNPKPEQRPTCQEILSWIQSLDGELFF